jgi:hypothetical protein
MFSTHVKLLKYNIYTHNTLFSNINLMTVLGLQHITIWSDVNSTLLTVSAVAHVGEKQSKKLNK